MKNNNNVDEKNKKIKRKSVNLGRKVLKGKQVFHNNNKLMGQD